MKMVMAMILIVLIVIVTVLEGEERGKEGREGGFGLWLRPLGFGVELLEQMCFCAPYSKYLH